MQRRAHWTLWKEIRVWAGTIQATKEGSRIDACSVWRRDQEIEWEIRISCWNSSLRFQWATSKGLGNVWREQKERRWIENEERGKVNFPR